jgi:hypothetical protein
MNYSKSSHKLHVLTPPEEYTPASVRPDPEVAPDCVRGKGLVACLRC